MNILITIFPFHIFCVSFNPKKAIELFLEYEETKNLQINALIKDFRIYAKQVLQKKLGDRIEDNKLEDCIILFIRTKFFNDKTYPESTLIERYKIKAAIDHPNNLQKDVVEIKISNQTNPLETNLNTSCCTGVVKKISSDQNPSKIDCQTTVTNPKNAPHKNFFKIKNLIHLNIIKDQHSHPDFLNLLILIFTESTNEKLFNDTSFTYFFDYVLEIINLIEYNTSKDAYLLFFDIIKNIQTNISKKIFDLIKNEDVYDLFESFDITFKLILVIHSSKELCDISLKDKTFHENSIKLAKEFFIKLSGYVEHKLNSFLLISENTKSLMQIDKKIFFETCLLKIQKFPDYISQFEKNIIYVVTEENIK